ncbi:MAG TPA: helix-turn-helix domain-containing protein [Candidatus Limnocylindrales bacterium]
MPHVRPTDLPVTFNELGDVLTLLEAATAAGCSEWTVRRAIRQGELPAFIPRGRVPLRAGKGMGYRIRKQDLIEWYFGPEDQAAPKRSTSR